jgi:hypothetical protein
MRLVRPIAAAFVGLLATGCGDPTAPKRVTALYILESINGQPLPATFSQSPIETATVFWATLNLDLAGNASMAERRRSVYATSQHERTNTWLTGYEITGQAIVIGPPCGSDVERDCAIRRYGEIIGSTLTLRESVVDAPVYLYHLAAN